MVRKLYQEVDFRSLINKREAQVFFLKNKEK